MKRQNAITISVIVAVAILVIFLRLAGSFWPFRIVNDQLVNPIGRFFSGIGRTTKEYSDLIANAGNLSKDNKYKDEQIINLKNQLSSLKEVANENQELRGQLNFNEKLSLNLAPARIVSSEGTSLRRYITIDRGKNSGISSGMAVVSSGVLVGVVDRVEDFSSTVFLSTDPEFRIRAIGQDGRAQGIVRGQLGQGYLFDKITQAENIKQNETVITLGTGLVPRGILIGEVESVQKSDNAVFQSAQLRPFVNISNQSIVFVVTGLKQ